MSYSESFGPRKRRERPKSVEDGFLFKVCLSGVSGVGKTSIFRYVLGKPFSEEPTVETDSLDFHAMVKHGPETEKVTLKLWDTAGQEQNDSLTLGYYRLAHLIIVVFDVGERDTLFLIEDITKNIIDSDNCPNARFFYVGNKTDLKEWGVTKDEVVSFISNNRVLGPVTAAIEFTSAKEGHGIEELFNLAASILIGSDIAPVDKTKGTVDFYHKTKKPSDCPCVI